MTPEEPTTYVIERIRAAVAACDAHQLGVEVSGDADHIVLRGTVDGPHCRDEVLAVARRFSGGRRVLDELECGGDEHVRAAEHL